MVHKYSGCSVDRPQGKSGFREASQVGGAGMTQAIDAKA